jgi:hypothetical protein
MGNWWPFFKDFHKVVSKLLLLLLFLSRSHFTILRPVCSSHTTAAAAAAVLHLVNSLV